MLPFEAPRRIVLDERLCLAGLAATPSVGGRWTCSVFDVVVNVGGFGQTEEQLVLQSRVRINAGLTLHPAGLLLAYTLVLKKKQFERLRL